MIELNIWADFIADKLELPYPDYKIRLTDFLEDNDWFGIETIWKDGALYIHKTDADVQNAMVSILIVLRIDMLAITVVHTVITKNH